MTLLTITDKLRNCDFEVSDLQSDSDLDSICDSCDVWSQVQQVICLQLKSMILFEKPLYALNGLWYHFNIVCSDYVSGNFSPNVQNKTTLL